MYKKRALVIIKFFWSLIVPIGFLGPYVSNVFFYERKQLATIASPFSYKSKSSKKEIGFNHIRFKQFEIYNPQTNNYEYYLDEYGKQYLIRRFLETTIIGPEVSSLKSIVIGDARVSDTNLGVYYPIAGMIFINPFPFLNSKKDLWVDENQKRLSERRSEIILSTLVHEYGHHFFNAYASSPIGYSFANDYNGHLNVKQTQHKKDSSENSSENWNKSFYDKFKNLFFENGIVHDNLYNRIRNNNFYDIILKSYNLKRFESKIKNKNLLLDYIDENDFDLQISEYKAIPKLYQEFENVKSIFEIANERIKNYSNVLDDQIFLVGSHFDEKYSSRYGSKKRILIIKKMQFNRIYYRYSIGEQVVRKLLLSTFKPSTKFTEIGKEFLDDNYYSNDYISNAYLDNQIKNNNWYRFYSDNVYPSANNSNPFLIGKNRSKAFVEEVIDELMGHKNYAELSFITTKNPWIVATKGRAYSTNKNNRRGDFDKIKIGGYIDSNDYNYIGYKSGPKAEFKKIPIRVNKFKIWYKNSVESNRGQNIGSYRGTNKEYYWYLKDFIDKLEIMNQDLHFLKVENGKVVKNKKLTSLRRSKYGIVNNFNSWKAHDTSFVESKMQDIGSGPKWLIVGKKSSTGVRLVYYDKGKQEITEGIWKK